MVGEIDEDGTKAEPASKRRKINEKSAD
jgi:hypothetical protein